jgi:hypothetical protein
MSANKVELKRTNDGYVGAGTHTGQDKIYKRIEALEQDVTELTILLHELLQRERIRDPGSQWEH